MRYFVLLLTIWAVVFVGCSGDPPPVSGVKSVSLVSQDTNNCGFGVDPCSKTFTLDFTDEGLGEWWFWVEVAGKDDTAVCRPVRLQNDLQTLQINGTVNYFQFSNTSDADSCRIKICSSVNAEDAGKRPTRGCQAYDSLVGVPAFDEECATCCCSNSDSRYWAFAAKDADEVIGVKCYLTTEYGLLCGEGCNSADSAFSGAWIGIMEEYGNSATPFFQAGYIRVRNYWDHPSETERFYVEFRLKNDNTSIFLSSGSDPPSPGSLHEYEMRIEQTLRDFSFRVDDFEVLGFQYPSGGWESETGQWAVWSGEIQGFETDMPGYSSAPCVFSSCKMKLDDGQGYRTVSFTHPPDKIGSSDTEEWHMEYNAGASSFRIWDLKPL